MPVCLEYVCRHLKRIGAGYKVYPRAVFVEVLRCKLEPGLTSLEDGHSHLRTSSHLLFGPFCWLTLPSICIICASDPVEACRHENPGQGFICLGCQDSSNHRSVGCGLCSDIHLCASNRSTSLHSQRYPRTRLGSSLLGPSPGITCPCTLLTLVKLTVQHSLRHRRYLLVRIPSIRMPTTLCEGTSLIVSRTWPPVIHM